MPGFVEPSQSMALTGAVVPAGDNLGFSVAHQKVELDVDLATRSVKGNTEITIQLHARDVRRIRLNFRQGDIRSVRVNDKIASYAYTDPCDSLKLYGVHYHQRLSSKIDALMKTPADPELTVTVPKHIRIDELDPFSAEAQNQATLRVPSSTAVDEQGDPLSTSKLPELPKFTLLVVSIEFVIEHVRDGLHFVGLDPLDRRYPHVYTNNLADTNDCCCLFPCVEDITARCTWEISVRCVRTVGDVYSRKRHLLTPEDEAMDMTVVCSGDLTDEIVDPKDARKKTVFFACNSPLSAQQIGFVIGPFEYINLSEYRESDEDDQLGQNAIPVYGFCLPGRADEVRNTCLPMPKAIDLISLSYGSYPFTSYKLCFVDDLPTDTVSSATLSLCSNRILFPDDIIDPLYETTRLLVHALAYQWVGINIIPQTTADTWVTVGLAYYITDTFMRKLCGNNEYRCRLKQTSDTVCDLDVARPSIYDMGTILRLDPSEIEFIALKAPLVLYILERRLSKASGKPTISRVISRIFLNARMGDLANGALTTSFFQKTCERFGHTKLDTFFQQWVYGAGCPRFQASQRFNKKKLVVEMLIRQVQSDQPIVRDLEKEYFIRDVKEEIQNIYAGPVQSVFTGSMTIRIHEADGTPYEHIVEIKDGVTKFDIPYNTKYKRLKRNKRQRERVAMNSNTDPNAEQDDVLLYCLGDVLQSEEDMQSWRLVDWSKEDEDRMGQESYEWIRMDADFEWICKMNLMMPGYMYLSQLQQDRDVVAQLESIQYLAAQPEDPLISTIFVRTLMDRRYFHGIRTAAAAALVAHAKESVDFIGLYHLEKAFQELFCLPGSPMTKTNDFTDRAAYMLQLAIPEAISRVRASDGKTPISVKRFLYDKLKFNDNSNNELSDCYYVATLLRSVGRALLGRGPSQTDSPDDDLDFDMGAELERQSEEQLNKDCMAEIDRYRRMDEWTSSFQNIYARTAIRCQRDFMRAGIIEYDPIQFLQYTRAGTFDLLRVEAFEILAGFNIFSARELLTWFIYNMSADVSPWVRRRLYDILGRNLAVIALGDETTKTPPPSPLENGLVIETEEVMADDRQHHLARRQTVPGALLALKQELEGSSSSVLKDALWAACNAPSITLTELRDLVLVCSVVWDNIDQLMVKLKYPRYWRCEHYGSVRPSLALSSVLAELLSPYHVAHNPMQGKVRFYKSDRFRTQSTPKWTPRTADDNNHTMANGALKRRREDSLYSSSHTPGSNRVTLKLPKLAAAAANNHPPASSYMSPASNPSPSHAGNLPKLKLKLKSFGSG